MPHSRLSISGGEVRCATTHQGRSWANCSTLRRFSRLYREEIRSGALGVCAPVDDGLIGVLAGRWNATQFGDALAYRARTQPDVTYQFAATPEPTTLLVFAVGMIGVAARARKLTRRHVDDGSCHGRSSG
jgi:hypothetical protein